MSNAPQGKLPKSAVLSLLWVVPVALALIIIAACVVVIANVVRNTPAVHSFLTTYPGQSALPDFAPIGFPAWLSWQHFLSAFFIVLIIRTGLLVRNTKRPVAFFTRKKSRISFDLWIHLSLDLLWIINGIVFIVLLFVSGQWVRIVPTSWDVIPNAISAALQYVTLNWPTDDGWINYNALQLLAYFVTVFIAAPLAIITGVRMSPLWPKKPAVLGKVFPIELARTVHFPVMLYFVLFIIVHVFLVFATGALRNLNHMYAGRDDETWWGLLIFAGSLVVMAIGFVLARLLFLRPVASIFGKVTR